MMFGGAVMMGAQDRLQPPQVPYRFFAAALAFHPLAWGLLLAGAGDVPGHMGGLGPVLSGLHAVTLGVLAMAALGASFQLLPVATRRQLGPVWACTLTFWLFAPGVALLCLGMALGLVPALHLGATLAGAGLLLGGGLMARTLAGVDDMPAVTRHAWIALVALVGLVGLGVALVADFQAGFLPDHAAVAATHAVLAGYGFMGSLAFGFSYVLVPMFVLAQTAPDTFGKRTSALVAVALVLGAAGTWSGIGWLAAGGGLVGLAATALYVQAIRGVLKTRMRRKLEPFFRLKFAGLALLPASLLAGMALALGAPAAVMAPLWGFLMVFGWLLTFVTGILQRIMPFLASMHSGTGGAKPALLSDLTARLPLDIHAVLHAAAVTVVTAGIILQSPWTVRAGAALGLGAALALAAFGIELARRWRAHNLAQ